MVIISAKLAANVMAISFTRHLYVTFEYNLSCMLLLTGCDAKYFRSIIQICCLCKDFTHKIKQAKNISIIKGCQFVYSPDPYTLTPLTTSLD